MFSGRLNIEMNGVVKEMNARVMKRGVALKTSGVNSLQEVVSLFRITLLKNSTG